MKMDLFKATKIEEKEERYVDSMVRKRFESLYDSLKTPLVDMPVFVLEKGVGGRSLFVEFMQDKQEFCIDDAICMVMRIFDDTFLTHGTKLIDIILYDECEHITEELTVSSDQEVLDKLKKLYASIKK